MKNTDKAELIRLAREAAARVPEEQDELFAQIDALYAEEDAKAKTLIKPRRERD